VCATSAPAMTVWSISKAPLGNPLP